MGMGTRNINLKKNEDINEGNSCIGPFPESTLIEKEINRTITEITYAGKTGGNNTRTEIIWPKPELLTVVVCFLTNLLLHYFSRLFRFGKVTDVIHSLKASINFDQIGYLVSFLCKRVCRCFNSARQCWRMAGGQLVVLIQSRAASVQRRASTKSACRCS